MTLKINPIVSLFLVLTLVVFWLDNKYIHMWRYNFLDYQFYYAVMGRESKMVVKLHSIQLRSTYHRSICANSNNVGSNHTLLLSQRIDRGNTMMITKGKRLNNRICKHKPIKYKFNSAATFTTTQPTSNAIDKVWSNIG